MYDFSADHNSIKKEDILNIHLYLMIKNNMFRFIKKIFFELTTTTTITSVVNVSSHAKCASVSNQKCMTQLTIINLYRNEYTQGLHYYKFSVNLDRMCLFR